MGKDTLAGHLVQNYGFERIGMADPMKRFCQEVFAFTDAQLYGDERDLPDKRYPRPHVLKVTRFDEEAMRKVVVFPSPEPTEEEIEAAPKVDGYLTPRFALQTLGTEWGRHCYADVWIEYAIRTAQALLSNVSLRYSAQKGLYDIENPYSMREVLDEAVQGVVFSDVRFKNEFDAIKKAGGILVRVYREGYDGEVGIAGHASETEQKSIPDSAFDYVIHNPPGLENYFGVIDTVLGEVLSKR